MLDEAYEDLVSDALSEMLVDGSVVESLAKLKQENKSLWEKIKEAIEDLLKRWGEILGVYKDRSLETAEAEALSGMQEAFKKVQQMYAEAFAKASEVESIVENKKAADGDLKMQAKKNSNYDYSKSFEEQIDDYQNGNFPQRDTFILGGTSKFYQKLGFNALPMTINKTHVDYALFNKKDADHFLGETLLKQLPEKINDPVAVFVSQTQDKTSVVSLLKFNVNGKDAIAPIYIDGFGIQNGIEIDSNAVKSTFGKNNAITKLLKDAIEEENKGKFSLLYVNKKEALSLLHRAGLQLPGTLIPDGGFIHSIREKNLLSSQNTKMLLKLSSSSAGSVIGRSIRRMQVRSLILMERLK